MRAPGLLLCPAEERSNLRRAISFRRGASIGGCAAPMFGIGDALDFTKKILQKLAV
jgi:hypothetical protein